MSRVSAEYDSRRQRHWTMLAVGLFVLVMPWMLQVHEHERIAFVGLTDYPLPHSCLSRSLLGTRCPGCGLTRSIICIVHGDFSGSLAMHRLGWLMALTAWGQIPYRACALCRPGRELLSSTASKLFGSMLIALLIGNWLVDCVSGHVH